MNKQEELLGTWKQIDEEKEDSGYHLLTLIEREVDDHGYSSDGSVITIRVLNTTLRMGPWGFKYDGNRTPDDPSWRRM